MRLETGRRGGIRPEPWSTRTGILTIPGIGRSLIVKEVIAMIDVLDRNTVIALDHTRNGNGDDPADHDTETAETLPLDVIAIERWLTEGGRVLPCEFDQ